MSGVQCRPCITSIDSRPSPRAPLPAAQLESVAADMAAGQATPQSRPVFSMGAMLGGKSSKVRGGARRGPEFCGGGRMSRHALHEA